MDNIIWCASFDIGKRNFSFCVEEINTTYLSGLQNPKNKYNSDGTPTIEFTETLNDVYKDGKIILIENVDITENCEKGSYLDPETFHNMMDVLEKYDDIWDKCTTFIIEKQMQFGQQINPMALKLGQHCYSYFCYRYGRFKKVIEYPAYNKTQVLGAQKTSKQGKTGKTIYKSMDKPARKKWCIEKAIEILKTRDDITTIAKIKSSKKKDDLCDVICQLTSWKYLTFCTN
jgi:hypothetical protein